MMTSRLHQPTELRVKLWGHVELEDADRQFLYRTRDTHQDSIKQIINVREYVVKNDTRGNYFISRLLDRFGPDHIHIKAQTELDPEDLPDDVQQAGRWNESLSGKVSF